jgi:ABC-type glycerol-3-phosphate transport system permease component
MAVQATSVDSKASQRAAEPRRWRFPSLARVLLHIVLSIGAVVCFFPFVFMVVKSLSSVYEASAWPPVWIPERLMFLNYSVAWSSITFGPTVKVVDARGSVSYAYIEFWVVVFVLANVLVAGLLAAYLGNRVRILREKDGLSLAVFGALALPTLVLLIWGAPARLETRDGYLPTSPEGVIKPLEVLGFDTQWSYQPPLEYLTSWEADRSLTPVVPITLGKFVDLAIQEDYDFFRSNVLNTIIVAGINVPAVLITSILAAYAFARIDFFGKNALFMIFLSTMMIPFEAILIPNYIIVAGALRWHNKVGALTIPFFVSVFNIFLLRQFFMSIPRDYFDAARIDGAGHLTFLRHVVLPMSRSPLAVVTLFTFLGVWNSFQWPLIAVRHQWQQIQVGMSGFTTEGGSDPQLIMAAATFTILPIVVLYFLTQKTFIESVASSGLKG